jgi:hypothetical protein
VKAGRLPQNGKLSPRYTWMASKETDAFTSRPETFIEGAGTSLKAAVDILRKYGTVPEALLPFHIGDQHVLGGRENAFFATAADAPHRRLFQPLQEPAELARLASPPTARSWSGSAWTRRGTTRRQPMASWMSSSPTPSAAATPSRASVTRPTVVFILRNSWGTSWGDHGFGYASEAYINAAFFR